MFYSIFWRHLDGCILFKNLQHKCLSPTEASAQLCNMWAHVSTALKETHSNEVFSPAGLMMTCQTRGCLSHPQLQRSLPLLLIKLPNWNIKARFSSHSLLSLAVPLQWKISRCERAVRRDEAIDWFGQLVWRWVFHHTSAALVLSLSLLDFHS